MNLVLRLLVSIRGSCLCGRFLVCIHPNQEWHRVLRCSLVNSMESLTSSLICLNSQRMSSHVRDSKCSLTFRKRGHRANGLWKRHSTQEKNSKLKPDNTAITKDKAPLTHVANNTRPLCMIDSRPGMRVISLTSFRFQSRYLPHLFCYLTLINDR